MRGTLSERGHRPARQGIIPADAGNTHRPAGSAWPYEDHPRGCGEHDHSETMLMISPGSSPRMRGTPVVHADMGQNVGIIPADAGNTLIDGC